MKRIYEKHSEKDRIICVTSDKHEFYYQPAKTSDRFWLFSIPRFSRSLFAYFRSRGCQIGEREYSLTIRELYGFRDFHNVRLAHILERIPCLVDYVIRNELSSADPVKLFCEPAPLPARGFPCPLDRDHAA